MGGALVEAMERKKQKQRKGKGRADHRIQPIAIP